MIDAKCMDKFPEDGKCLVGNKDGLRSESDVEGIRGVYPTPIAPAFRQPTPLFSSLERMLHFG